MLEHFVRRRAFAVESDEIGKSSFHFSEPVNTQPEKAGDDADAKRKARPVDAASSGENGPAEAVDDTNQRIQTVKEPPLFWDHAAAETNRRNIETELN